MKNYKKIFAFLLIMAMALSMLAGCKKKAEETPTETQAPQTQLKVETKAPETEPATESDSIPEGMMRNFTNGEIVDKETGMKRPFAIMLNNISEAMPQYGIRCADIIYEAEVEGGITRLLGVFSDASDAERVGSIRSARHNYLDFAHDVDGIYTHYGWSVVAQSLINNNEIPTLRPEVDSGSTIFYRADDRSAPHDVFTTMDRLETGVEMNNYERNHAEGYTGNLNWYPVDTDLENGNNASKISLPYNSGAYFEYDSANKVYNRFQYGGEQIDGETGDQLTFKNVLALYAHQENYEGTILQDLDLYTKGNGIYATNGKAVNITWEKKDADDQTHFYNEDGSELQLNVGKTFIAYVSTEKTVTVE